jgi:hypothetical protein
VKDWSAEFTTPKFAITSDFGEREELGARPQVYLESTYAVQLAEAAEHIYFQERDSHERFPVEVIQTIEEKSAGPPEATGFRVAPREPLPVGHTFDLIVNGLLDAKSRRPLRYLRVIPVGKTEPLKVEWVGAFNHALGEPSIRIKFNDDIDPVEMTAERIHVEPAVQKMKLLASGSEVEITGSFDTTQRYKVTISPELKGDRGYGLPAESRWGATFRPKESCLVFPSSQVFARARQELRFAFFQINTPQVTWRLARIPAGTYPSLARPYQTVGLYNFAVAREDLPGDLVYRAVKAVFPGASSTIVSPEQFDTPMSFDAMRAVGSALGSGAFVVYDDSACIAWRSRGSNSRVVCAMSPV